MSMGSSPFLKTANTNGDDQFSYGRTNRQTPQDSGKMGKTIKNLPTILSQFWRKETRKDTRDVNGFSMGFQWFFTYAGVVYAVNFVQISCSYLFPFKKKLLSFKSAGLCVSLHLVYVLFLCSSWTIWVHLKCCRLNVPRSTVWGVLAPVKSTIG